MSYRPVLGNLQLDYLHIDINSYCVTISGMPHKKLTIGSEPHSLKEKCCRYAGSSFIHTLTTECA